MQNKLFLNTNILFKQISDDKSYLETTLLKSVLKLLTLNANKTFDANCRTCWTVIPSPGTFNS
jgi:hypothetical protein